MSLQPKQIESSNSVSENTFKSQENMNLNSVEGKEINWIGVKLQTPTRNQNENKRRNCEELLRRKTGLEFGENHSNVGELNTEKANEVCDYIDYLDLLQLPQKRLNRVRNSN